MLAEAIRVDIPLPAILASLPIVRLSAIAAVTPGGLGIVEGGWFITLSLAGVSGVDMSTFLIARRVYWMIFSGLLMGGMWVVVGPSQVREMVRVLQRARAGREGASQ